jgi:hypothetical protein
MMESTGGLLKLWPLKESKYSGWKANMEASLKLYDLWGPVIESEVFESEVILSEMIGSEVDGA